jgi:hypothetical protein
LLEASYFGFFSVREIEKMSESASNVLGRGFDLSWSAMTQEEEEEGKKTKRKRKRARSITVLHRAQSTPESKI